MAKYEVLVSYELNEKTGVDKVEVEAAALYFAQDWLVFDKGMHARNYEVVACFPKERVVWAKEVSVEAMPNA